MAKQINIGSVKTGTIQKKYSPSITFWNRLEGSPRTTDFNRALKAEVRDPLWMLSKQWQTGEFQGEDAGSAILAKAHIKTTSLTKYESGKGVTSPFNNDIPLEVKVEHQEIPFQLGTQEISLDLRLLMGRQWFKMLGSDLLKIKKGGTTFKEKYLKKYGFTLPNPEDEKNFQIYAHIEVWQQFAAVAQRCIDGYKLFSDLKKENAADLVPPPLGEETKINALGEKFIQWFEKLYYQPAKDQNQSWKPAYLEYQFACSAPQKNNEKVLIANEYYHGQLDWYHLDIHHEKMKLPASADAGTTASVEDAFTLSFLPSPITFPGMPHKRWWTLEDWKTNLGNIKPDTTDINQLMLLDFTINYANDWFVLPFTLPVGSIANVEGLMVTNVFGERVWVDAAGKGDDEEWNRWSMFKLNVRGNMDVPSDLSLILPPTTAKVQEGKPHEEVYLLRDEIANMVWGVESQVPLATGKSKPGKEAGRELRVKYQQLIDKPVPVSFPIQNDAKIKYQIVNTVPENWIPFVPVHKKDDNRQIQIQRAAMPRILEGADYSIPPQKTEPRTSILRVGLDEVSETGPQKYFIHEEEVPRAGIKITKSFQRTRWQNGKVFTWLGFRKQVGRGEGHSGLAFDQIIPKE